VLYSKKSGIYDFVLNQNLNLLAIEPRVEDIQNALERVFLEDSSGIVSKQKMFAREFTWENVVRQYLEVYRRIQSETEQ